VPERSNGAVLKTAEPQGSVSSNLTPAASGSDVWKPRDSGDNRAMEEDIPEFQRRLLGIVDKSLRSGIRVEPLAYAELLRIRQQVSGHPRRPRQGPAGRSAPAGH
jgi:hypothetical protein